MSDFYDMFAALPRQTVGSDASTRAALAAIADRLPRGRPLAVADMGCGTGRPSLVLAAELDCRIVALDIRPNALGRLAAAVAQAGLGGRVLPVCADMAAPPLAPASLDLIWCEGAVFVLGAGRACAEWGRLLRPGGWLVFSDAVWSASPDAETVAAMTGLGITLPDRAELLRAVRAAGLVPGPVLPLPDGDWWDEYYLPLADLLETCPPSPHRDATWREIELRWMHPASTEYVFVLAQRPG